MPIFPQAFVGVGNKGEHLWSRKDLHAWISSGKLDYVMLDGRPKNDIHSGGYEIMSDVDAAYETATKTIDKALEAYQKVVADFRGTIKNDLASISSSAAKVQAESGKMLQAYVNTQTILTTPKFEQAIVNAERLAVALKAISELSETKVAFAVMNGGTK